MDPIGSKDQVILVDEQDNPIGICGKLPAHQNGGALHRAFSVFIFDSKGRMLLQRRAPHKYHFAGLWTNACCGHPRTGQETADAARTRLREEFGVEADVREVSAFIYRAHDPASGLTEQEFDHVFTGLFDGVPGPNPEEIDAWRWVGLKELDEELNQRPGHFTPWFPIALRQLRQKERAGD